MQVATLRRALIFRQRQTFPILRDKAGGIFSNALWESDGKARTFGARYATVEFVNGSFAAHANIAKSHEAIRALLVRLRFKRAEYKWYSEADEYSYYTIESPKDSDIAIVDDNGIVIPVPE